MWRVLIVFIILVAGSRSPGWAQGEALYEDGKRAWEQQVWPDAYRPLREYRLLSYGLRPDVDYMLGTSGCRIPGLRDWGGNMLSAMLYVYPLNVDSRKVVYDELQLCRRNVGLTGERLQLALIDWPPAGMTAVFKTFYWNSDVLPAASYPMRRLETFAREHFTERLVPIGDAVAARSAASTLSPAGQVVVSNRLILISESGHSEADLERMALGLDQFVAFLEHEYGIGPLPHYITIVLVADSYQLQSRARELHGLDVSGATLGYSYADDLSIVAFVPDAAPGTVLHEIFHLLVRSDYGNIPMWLDEGIASLYEVSVTDGERYWGTNNWRGEVLEGLWDVYRPTVSELIRSDWHLLDDPAQAEAIEAGEDDPDELIFRQEESARHAATMAMARYFALYLQETGQLREVFENMRTNDPAASMDREIDPRDHAVAVVEDSLGGRSLDAVDDEFSAWFLAGAAAGATRPSLPLDRVDKSEPNQAYAATASVNIRRGPDTSFSSIGGLDAGDPVAVVSTENGWAEIRLQNGGSGYVSMRYLTPLP